MALWPFGRKSKRHTIQVSPDEAAALQTSLEQATPETLGRKLSRRASKRQNTRTRTGDGSDSLNDSARTRPISLHHRMSEQHDRPSPDLVPQRRLSYTGSMLKKQPPNGPKKLQKSKRRTDEILRERHIRMLSSTPIDIPRRTLAPDGDYVLEHRKRKANGRRADRYMSDISLSIRDSAASSISDISDPFTYKVNAFAALTPRPVVRYVEAPRLATARSQEPANKESVRRDKDRLQALTMSEENLYYSRRRVNELADSLDAGGLRELLDRDRRRREKQQIDEQEKLRRKLQERADEQAAEERRQAIEATTPEAIEPQAEPEVKNPVAVQDDTEQREEQIQIKINEPTPLSAEEPETWLREESKGSDAARRESLDSANVVANIDNTSVREIPKLSTRPSFAPSHEMGMSRTTLSPSHSSIRQGISSPSQSQTFGIGSASDLSERRSSDTSGRRGNTITSLFRRGSSRLKRRYRERFQESAPEIAHSLQPSNESFYKVHTQSSPPAPSAFPPRTFMSPGTVMRSQSKFTEHFDFGDEPLSPPDSRLQSPDIPEQVPESSLENEESTFLHGTTPTAGVDIINPRRRRHQSWNDSIDAESDNVPLSQSLASIDSEGSWMSGSFFRRMSQKPGSPGSPVRANMTSFEAAMDGTADTHDDSRDSVDSRRTSSHVMGEPELDDELGATEAGKPSEMWHRSEFGRRPMIVNPTVRPKSTQGMLKSIPSLSPISAEEDYISDEETNLPPAPQRVASQHGIISHVELEQD
ncbi:uncharacterized protein N7443_000441 [Penicillium atrosanguineum]|uniref:uncharacterized protein n=1 Tax=Penicillium atrosanguineum TaxID=1132637 RepID=UPI00239444ED|nr:uncharacterized protein N7443_000441 [Penicillium atrosanguineum]KAJ5313557.1 hypothetical protein N7443_000441 [Penicillium atrosanguineum]